VEIARIVNGEKKEERRRKANENVEANGYLRHILRQTLLRCQKQSVHLSQKGEGANWKRALGTGRKVENVSESKNLDRVIAPQR